MSISYYSDYQGQTICLLIDTDLDTLLKQLDEIHNLSSKPPRLAFVANHNRPVHYQVLLHLVAKIRSNFTSLTFSFLPIQGSEAEIASVIRNIPQSVRSLIFEGLNYPCAPEAITCENGMNYINIITGSLPSHIHQLKLSTHHTVSSFKAFHALLSTMPQSVKHITMDGFICHFGEKQCREALANLNHQLGGNHFESITLSMNEIIALNPGGGYSCQLFELSTRYSPTCSSSVSGHSFWSEEEASHGSHPSVDCAYQ